MTTEHKQNHRDIAYAYDGGMTLDECAAKFQCSVSTVRHAMKKYGIEPRDRTYRSGDTVKAKKIIVPGAREQRREKSKSPERHFRAAAPEPQVRTHPVRDEILKHAIKACEKFGGMASIDGRYAIVDTLRFEVKSK